MLATFQNGLAQSGRERILLDKSIFLRSTILARVCFGHAIETCLSCRSMHLVAASSQRWGQHTVEAAASSLDGNFSGTADVDLPRRPLPPSPDSDAS